jgi:hypothetical protein
MTDESKLRELVKKWRVPFWDAATDRESNRCADELESLIARQPHYVPGAGMVYEPVQPVQIPESRFVPGMRIGPGHGRPYEETLKEYCQRTYDGGEWWLCESGHPFAWPFFPDDSSRVIFDPRWPAVRTYAESPEQIKAHSVTYTEKPAQWKSGQRLVSLLMGHIWEVVSYDGSKYSAKQWMGDHWSEPDHPWNFYSDTVVTWPRVGDWVRCTSDHNCSREGPWRVVEVVEESVKDSRGWFYSPGVLEPASPPEQSIQEDTPIPFGSVYRRPKSPLTTEQRIAVTAEVTKEMAGRGDDEQSLREREKNLPAIRNYAECRGEHPQRFTGPHWEYPMGATILGRDDIAYPWKRDLDLARAIEAIESKLLKES